MSSALPNRLKDADYPAVQTDVDDSVRNAAAASISQAEADGIRAGKLQAIQDAIAAGEYDSDDVLQAALGKMIESVKKQD